MSQYTLFDELVPLPVDEFDLHSFDYYIVTFSAGKDSTACLLYLLEQGVDRAKIELWHHDIDGKAGTFMDWECTPAYCEAFAKAFGLPLYHSWKKGGFLGELLRQDSLTAPTVFEDQNRQLIEVGGKHGEKTTRRKFPQLSADLSVRWCSSYLKIDVGAAAIRNQARFKGKRTLVLSGERGEESPARAKYNMIEPDKADLRDGKKPRYVERFRPIRDWKEQEIWAIIKRWKVVPHPAYFLGWGRVSCKLCIFGNANQFASAKAISPKQTQQVVDLEREFGVTIKRSENLQKLMSRGTVYTAVMQNPQWVRIALSDYYDGPIFTDNWVLPAGAYGESCGPI